MTRKRTTISLPPDLIDLANRNGINISRFCARALDAFFSGAPDTVAAATRVREEFQRQAEIDRDRRRQQVVADQEINRILMDYIGRNRDQILRHLARYGSIGRKAIERFRAEIYRDSGWDVPPGRIRTALAEFHRQAQESGDLMVAIVQLSYDREYRQHGQSILDYITNNPGQLAQAKHVKAEQDEGLTSIWAHGIIEYFADRGIVIHTPTVYRVLDTISIDQPAATSARESQHVPQHTYHSTA